jgi:nodulation protein E
MDRFAQLAVVAADEALADAGLAIEGELGARTAAVLGTGIGGQIAQDDNYRRLYAEGAKRLHPFVVPRVMPSSGVSQICIRHGIRGPSFAICSACASSGHALAQSLAMLRSGLVDVAVTGGTEACLTLGGFKTWEALRVLSSDTCRPFSADRSGLVLGEGAAVLVLESAEHARARGARIYAELLGAGMSSDAERVIQSSALGGAAAMQAALRDGQIDVDRVDYVNAHGTGTEGNDPTETESIHRALGSRARDVWVSSTKSMHGHLLGGAAALEAVATVLAIQRGIVPPTANFTSPGEGCDLDYVPNTARERDIRVALSNSFAFGGLNAVVAFGAVERA